MTPGSLDAIRARDAENRLLRLGPEADPDLGDFIGAAVLDRRALLAEVDRLRAKVPFLVAEVDRLTAMWESASVGYIRDTERARIRDAVRGLDYGRVDGGDIDGTEGGMFVDDSEWTEVLDRAAVLAVIDGADR